MFLLIIAVAILLILTIGLRLEIDRYKKGLILLNDQVLTLFITAECIRQTINLNSEDIDIFIRNYREELNLEK